MTPAAAELCAQWAPRLRRIAFETGCPIEDVRQTAWLLAATMPGRAAGGFVAVWLRAVEVQTSESMRSIIGSHDDPAPAWIGGTGSELDDPAAVIEAAQEVERRLDGQDIGQIINEPRTAREIALVTGKSERQARRIKRQIEALAELQGDFWGEPA